jgi:transcriptional regulator with XRE-family HTH domain
MDAKPVPPTGCRGRRGTVGDAGAKPPGRSKENGNSQRTLAARTGLARNYLIRIERGQANPTLGVLAALALTVGVPCHDLISAGEADDVVGLSVQQRRG